MKITVIGYQPDLDPTQPGTLVDVAGMVPSINGIKGAPAPVTGTVSAALAAACRGAFSAIRLDGAVRVFAGSGVRLYEASGASWTDRTRATVYALSSSQRWRFAQFGDTTLACGSTAAGDLIQQSSSGAFADIAGSPRAEVIEVVKNFAIVFNTVEASLGTRPDAWWCSGINDITAWTPSISTQCATGQLRGGAGPIKGAKRFGDQIVAYKENAMFMGQYVGAPEIWRWTLVPGNQGALSHEAVVNIGTDSLPRHFFMGLDDFYIFDGSRTQPVGLPIKQTVFGTINRSAASASQICHDAVNGLLYCFYPVTNPVNPEKCVVYNYRTDKWGRADRDVEAVLEYISPSITYGDLGTYYSTYADLPNSSYGTFALSSAAQKPGFFNAANFLQTFTGVAASSSMTLGDMGDDRLWSTISSLKPRYLLAPTTAQMTNYYRSNLGDTLVADQTVSQSTEKRFDAMRSARWHRVQLQFTGDVEFNTLDADVIQDGAY